MTCSRFIDSFSRYVDGSGSPAFVAEAEAHLETCSECRRYLEVYRRGTDLLRSFPEVEVSDDFRPRLRHRIFHVRDEEALARAREGSGSAATAATALGMAVLLVLAAWSPVVLDRAREVELSPIVVSLPESRAPGLQPPPADLLPVGSPVSVPTGAEPGADNLWSESSELLFRHSPLYDRSRSASVRRTGLQ
jgi:hypothetical protein